MHTSTTRAKSVHPIACYWSRVVAAGCAVSAILACTRAENQAKSAPVVEPTVIFSAGAPGVAGASVTAAASARSSGAAATGASATAQVTSGVAARGTLAATGISSATASSARTPQTTLDALATAATAAAKRLVTPPQMVASGASGNHYIVGYNALSGCAVDVLCTGTVTLTATGGYHINNEFPYKFVVDAAPGVEWQTSDGRSFGKGTGEFVKTGELTALISLRYRGKQPGSSRLAGTFKMSVCSDANCQVESVPLAVAVTFQQLP